MNGSEAHSSAAAGTKPTYGEEDIEHGLQAMAIASGNSRKANELLRYAGYRAPDHTTLNRWAIRIHQERYRDLQREMRDELNARRARHPRSAQSGEMSGKSSSASGTSSRR